MFSPPPVPPPTTLLAWVAEPRPAAVGPRDPPLQSRRCLPRRRSEARGVFLEPKSPRSSGRWSLYFQVRGSFFGVVSLCLKGVVSFFRSLHAKWTWHKKSGSNRRCHQTAFSVSGRPIRDTLGHPQNNAEKISRTQPIGPKKR